MKDIILNGKDLVIKNGDLLVNESENQHLEHLLQANQGDYKQFPLTGINTKWYLASPLSIVKNRLLREIRLQCEDNDISINEIEFIGSQILFQ